MGQTANNSGNSTIQASLTCGKCRYIRLNEKLLIYSELIKKTAASAIKQAEMRQYRGKGEDLLKSTEIKL